ncbi:MAG: imidazole glycerol phosphate synthase subunit HisF [Alphaproteobacteria bacterium]
MLRKRLVTVLTFNDGVLFRTKMFTPDYRYTLNFVDAWSVDEIVVLDITRPGSGNRANFEDVVSGFARRCFVPLAAGGGIRSVDDASRALDLGADKVVINTGAVERPALIGEIAQRYGSQCVVLSIDAARGADGGYEVMAEFGSRPTGRTPADWASEAVELGAGEILITSIERDGSLAGYDLDLCRSVAGAVPAPVLICGGAGNWKHFAAGIGEGGASAVCTANIYHFTEASIRSAKQHMARSGIDVRLD